MAPATQQDPPIVGAEKTHPLVQQAKGLEDTSPAQAIALYQRLVSSATADSAESIDSKARELALLQLGSLYKKLGHAKELANLISSSLTFLSTIPKAKTAKIIRTLIDLFSGVPESLPLQVKVCKETIEWATREKRAFLRQALETRLAALYLDNKQYSDALTLIASLLKELKKLDDKNVLTEVQLLESRVYFALKNLPKARAALTTARTSANAIYCPPLLQAALDMQSGVLHAEEKDYKTAYSYFYETLENYSQLEGEEGNAISALKYMLMCKIMLNLTSDVHAIINGKIAVNYVGTEVEAMRAVAAAHQNRSLLEFEQALAKYRKELGEDLIIKSHLTALYDTLLEQNLLRIIEPYSKVQIAHIATLVKLPTAQVEAKLSQMILDQVFYGILQVGNGAAASGDVEGCLEIFDAPSPDKVYEGALDTISQLSVVVESLYEQATALS